MSSLCPSPNLGIIAWPFLQPPYGGSLNLAKFRVIVRSLCFSTTIFSLECAIISSDSKITGCLIFSLISNAFIVSWYVSCAELGARTMLS